MKRRIPLSRSLAIGTLAIIATASISVVTVRAFRNLRANVTVPYSAVLSGLDAGRVDSVIITPGRSVTVWQGAARSNALYTAANADDLIARAMQAGAVVSFRPAGQGATPYIAVTLALGLLVAGTLVLRRNAGFGGSGSELGERAQSDTTFEQVAGNSGAKSELQEVVQSLRDPERFQRVGARTPRGILLYGPPGTGKTLMARAVAGEAEVPFWTISGSEVTGFIVGLGAMRIKSLFRKARKKGGVIFIDEIDALGGRRGRNRAHNEDDRTLNQLLVEMDGFAGRDNVVVIAATNRPDDLDKALLRPGRFDRSICVPLPTAPEREAILSLHVRERRVPVSGGVDLSRLARLMPQTSGADLANLLNEAAIVAAREESETVAWQHFEAARDRVLLGKERKGLNASAHEWRLVAMHESGHALLGVVGCPDDPLHKVTIQPRGEAMGVAFFAPDADRHLHSRRYLEGQILKGLGGRAAEEVIFGPDRITSGARSDLQHVTRVAREMIYNLGMGETAGLMVYDPDAPPSEEVRALMDREVRALLDRLYSQALDTVRLHQSALEALGEALLERETLDAPEALAIFEAHGVALSAKR
ncbi:MAG TPA: AAA family ATPase [Gemmatimonadales bacterium]|nr:AAA family ATPase [Gemmatimonadales bacterium]